MFPMIFFPGNVFPLEMMPGFLQKFARVLPLYYVNEGRRASTVFVGHGAAVVAGVAAGVFVLGIRATRWEENT